MATYARGLTSQAVNLTHTTDTLVRMPYVLRGKRVLE